MKQVVREHNMAIKCEKRYFRQETLCYSLSGIEVPILTVTSRLNKDNFQEIDREEFASNEDTSTLGEYKKYIFLTSRVYPGETVASFMMEGFIKFITSQTDIQAQDLRKKFIFKIVPILNPDGLIIGNCRASMSGNDLNRVVERPSKRLQPTMYNLKELIK